MFVVAGVSGHTGSVVASTLLARGAKVRVVVRSADRGALWKSKGAEVAIASLDDANALAKAFTGAQGAYLLVPPDPTSSEVLARGRRFVAAFVNALAKTPLPHVAFLSSIGAQHATGTGPIRQLHDAEQRLGRAHARCTFVRASYFMENLGTLLLPMREHGVLPTFTSADTKFPMVATADIGEIAASALLAAPAASEVVELSGPAECSFRDAAGVFAKALGRSVAVAPVAAADVVPFFVKAGLSRDMAELYREMLAGMDSGRVAFERGPRTRAVRGKTTLAEVATALVASAA